MRDKVIAKALKDAEFRKKLVKDPAAALTELGVKVPAGMKIKVVEDSAETVHLVLPPSSSAALSEADLAKAAGGGEIPPCLRYPYQPPTVKREC